MHAVYTIKVTTNRHTQYYNPYLQIFSNQPQWTTADYNNVKVFVNLLNKEAVYFKEKYEIYRIKIDSSN